MRSSPACPVIATSGAPSSVASATPVRRLVAPGPSVARQTPGYDVSRPETSAMNAAPCSWRTTTCVILELSASARPSASVSSPGSANTWRTPSFSRHATTSCATFIVASLFGVRDLRCHGRGSDPDGLDVDELTDPEARELAAIADLLRAAERQPRIGGDHPVDEDRARLDATREGPRSLQIGGPERRAEAVRRGVRDPHRLVGIVDGEERGDRTERLFLQDRHLLGHAGEQRRLVEPALPGAALPADHDARTHPDGALDLSLERVAQVLARERADLRRRIERVADAQRADRVGEAALELGGDRRFHEEPFRRDARLPGILEARPHRRRD